MQGLNLFSGLKKNCNEIPCTSDKELATTELLSSSGNVKAGLNLPETRYGHGMLVINKKLIIFGGWTNDKVTNSVLVYNTDDLTRYVSRVVEYHKNFFPITCSSHDFTNLFHKIFSVLSS